MQHSQSPAFSTTRYLRAQAEAIHQRLDHAGERLYLEFGGKVLNDRHAARVLPGYDEDAKLQLLRLLRRQAEFIFVISAHDITRRRIRGDFKITYDQESLRVLKALADRGIAVRHVALTMVPTPVPPVLQRFVRRLQRRGFVVHQLPRLDLYPRASFRLANLAHVPFIPVRRRIAVILSPGGGSGKFGVCLSQLYHELARGTLVNYLKFETFPVYDLPVTHPINLAYMAASADFYDLVMRDRRKRSATSYNRDQQNFELLYRLARAYPGSGRLLRRIRSATGMGANRLSRGFVDAEEIERAAAAEIARRVVRYRYEVAAGHEQPHVLARARRILRML